MSIWGDIAGGAVQGAGYLEHLNNLREGQDNVNQSIGDLQQGVMDNGGFKGWGVTSNLGGIQQGEDGNVNFQLNEGQANQQMQQNQWAHDMFQRANQGTAERQQDLLVSFRHNGSPRCNRLTLAYSRTPTATELVGCRRLTSVVTHRTTRSLRQ